MNSRQKGARNELKAKKILESNGWLVYKVRGSCNRFNQNNDIFGLFDLCAKNGMYTKWVQVKTNTKPPLQPFINFHTMYCSPYESVEVWVWFDRQGFKTYMCDGGGEVAILPK